MRKSYYENIDGAVLVVNINDMESVSEVSVQTNYVENSTLINITKS